MVNKVVDHRTDLSIKICDAVLELASLEPMSYERKIVTGFQAEPVAYIMSAADKLYETVNVYLYDLNSKPLK